MTYLLALSPAERLQSAYGVLAQESIILKDGLVLEGPTNSPLRPSDGCL